MEGRGYHGEAKAGGPEAQRGPGAAPEAQRGPLDPRADALARRVLDECRTSLMMSFRFLDLALWRLPFRALGMDRALATDGRALYYDPELVLKRFREDPNEVARDYLHVLLHCVFRHPFETHRRDAQAWQTACDMTVETIAQEMCAGRYACALDGRRARVIAGLRGLLGSVTPAKAYRLIVDVQDKGSFSLGGALNYADVIDVSGLFIRDSHELWDLREDAGDQGDPPGGTGDSDDAGNDGAEGDSADDAQPQDGDDNPGDEGAEDGEDAGRDEGDVDDGQPGDEGGDGDGESSGDAGGQGDAGDDEGEAQAAGGALAGQDGEAPYEEGSMDAIEAEEAWRDIAERMETDLQTLSAGQGAEAGNLMANLELACRKQVDYRDFLRQFATVAEDMRLNDEEFDYVFYTYGLSLYGNMPLVEALEYKESERVREFAIAIDTSGSTSGDLVRRFMMRTYEILKETESFGDEVNIHIIQCDAQVQDDTVVTSLADLDCYCDDLQIRGLGGTDFRPVFAYVGQLVEQGAFENLRGLVYFTDGMGTYPDTAPDYDVAFVFVDEDGLRRRVPPWAMRVVMDEAAVRQL